MHPLLLINTVGLTSRLLAHAPRLSALAKSGWCVPLKEVVPAVTCTAQAAILTGQPASRHGIVGNGWLYRETGEVRFWQQSNRLLQAEPIYVTARRRATQRNRNFTCVKLFWWFNQGAAVDFSVTPKPYYGADGNKVFDVLVKPDEAYRELELDFKPFPFQTFWGPMAGLPCTQWISECAAQFVGKTRSDLTLVYLPHLDYDPQRFGPDGCDMPRLVRELDDACEPLLETAKQFGARIRVVSECGHVSVRKAVLPNVALRNAGMLAVRPGPFGENLDTFASRAFAVCDHQIAHIYVNDAPDIRWAQAVIAPLPGVARVYVGDEREELNLMHERSGDLIALAEPDAWFAYPFWLDDRQAPDYARTVDIHRKPGYDPCELFFNPKLWWPKGRAMRRLIQKKLGFRTLFDVIPLDPTLVKGSHGLPAADPQDRPILIGNGPLPEASDPSITDIHGHLLRALDLDGGDA